MFILPDKSIPKLCFLSFWAVSTVGGYRFSILPPECVGPLTSELVDLYFTMFITSSDQNPCFASVDCRMRYCHGHTTDGVAKERKSNPVEQNARMWMSGLDVRGWPIVFAPYQTDFTLRQQSGEKIINHYCSYSAVCKGGGFQWLKMYRSVKGKNYFSTSKFNKSTDNITNVLTTLNYHGVILYLYSLFSYKHLTVGYLN